MMAPTPRCNLVAAAWAACCWAALALPAAAQPPVAAPPPAGEIPAGELTFRGVLRKQTKKQGVPSGALAQETGLATVCVARVRVAWLDPATSQERHVDPEKHVFRPGDQFRIEIETDTDARLHALLETADGRRIRLLPNAEDAAPTLVRGARRQLPEEGDYFQIVPPLGVEKLLLLLDNRLPAEAARARGPAPGNEAEANAPAEAAAPATEDWADLLKLAQTTPLLDGGPSKPVELGGRTFSPTAAEGRTCVFGAREAGARVVALVAVPIRSAAPPAAPAPQP